MRQITALFTCLLVITLSFASGTSVCAGMSQTQSSGSHHGGTDHGKSQHSHQGEIPASHCAASAACTTLSDSPAASLLALNAASAETVTLMLTATPASAARDLETPPPRA